MMKTIFIKIPYEDLKKRDSLLMSPELLGKFINIIKDATHNDFRVVPIPGDFAIMDTDG